MTNLTEKLKRGELPDNHHYYFKLPKSKEYEVGNTFCLETLRWCKDGDKIEVLSEVPSYEEYLSLTYAKEEDERIIAEYEAENTKLKELLKRARGLMNCTKDWACTEATEEMIAKINQVLGEE